MRGTTCRTASTRLEWSSCTLRAALRSFLVEYDVRPVPFGADHWRVAAQAFARFGRGRHPAALNYGDCLSYASARVAGAPLLCVGGDFAQTDLELVPLPS